jgi:integrase
MALRFQRLTRPAIRAMQQGEKLAEHGITAARQTNGDVRYSVNVMVDGERIHRVIGRESDGVTREQAERAIEKFRTDAREGRLNLPTGRKVALSFGEAADLYIKHLEAAGGKNIDRKRQQLRSHLVPYFGKHKLSAISDFLVANYVKRRRDAGALPSTINRETSTLSQLFKTAVTIKPKWIPREAIPEIPHQKEGEGRIIALSPLECDALMRGAIGDQDPDLWLFVMIGLNTSMRHGEIKRLRLDYLDEHRRRFFIPVAKAGEREQPMTEELVRVLVGIRDERDDKKGYLFPPGPGSKTPHRGSFRKAFRRAVERAGLDPELITPHVMRHTAISRLVKAGADLPTIQRISGHKTLAMVLRYTHIDGLHIDAATEALSTGFPGAVTPELHTPSGEVVRLRR